MPTPTTRKNFIEDMFGNIASTLGHLPEEHKNQWINEHEGVYMEDLLYDVLAEDRAAIAKAAATKAALSTSLSDDKAVKADTGKLRFDLLPVKPLQDIVHILTLGVDKYTDRNWEKGMKWGRLFAATMRHLWSWWGGESTDPETNQSHLAHAASNIMFLMEYEYTKKEYDDRPTTMEKTNGS